MVLGKFIMDFEVGQIFKLIETITTEKEKIYGELSLLKGDQGKISYVSELNKSYEIRGVFDKDSRNGGKGRELDIDPESIELLI